MARSDLLRRLGAAAALVLVAGCGSVPLGRTRYASSVTSGYTSHDPRDVASILTGLTAAGLTGFPEPEADILATEAATYAANASCDRPSGATESRLGFRSGLYDHHTRSGPFHWTGGVAEDQLAASIRTFAAEPPSPEDANCPVAVGAARVVRGDATWIYVVLSARCVTLDSPLSRILVTGQTLSLAGTVAAGYRATSVDLTTPDGRVESSELAPPGDAPAAGPTPGVVDAGAVTAVGTSHFSWTHRFARAGRYVVELVAENAVLGPTPVMKAELLVGVGPSPANERCAPTTTEAVDRATAETLDLLNQSRGSYGLAALTPDPRLSEAARLHSQDMRDNHYFGHWSPSGSQPEQRARDSGAPIAFAAENVASGSDAYDMHDGLMESPGHRASILSRDLTHVGIGIVPTADGLYLTELFARIAPALDVARDRAAGLQAVARAIGHEPAIDPRLQGAAQAAAEHFFAADAPAEAATCVQANRVFDSVAAAGGNCVTWRLRSVEDLAQVSVFRGHYDRFGIGLAQGHRADGPPGELFAVVLGALLHRESVDPRAFERQVLDAANTARAASGAPPLRADAAIAQASGDLAAEWLRGVPAQQLYQHAGARQHALHLDQATLRYQAGAISSPSDVTRWEVLLDPAMRRVGIGVVQGDRSGGVGNTIGMFVYAATE